MAGVRSVKTYRSGDEERHEDLVAVEEPLEIRIGFGPSETREQKSISVTMRTPGHDEELAIGFLLSEGVISSPHDIQSIKHCQDIKAQTNDNIIRAELDPNIRLDLERLSRNFYTTSSCGVCGKASIEAVQFQTNIRLGKYLPNIDAELIKQMPEVLRNKQVNFRHTGGIHAVGLFDQHGRMLVIREDVGRHNAMDKLVGATSLDKKVDRSESIVVVSGRASFELVQKAVMVGIPVMAAVGAPSSLAVELAEEYGMTLIGFLREDRFNIYSGAFRLK